MSDHTMYYLRQEVAEQKCMEGGDVGFIDTWTNTAYHLSVTEDGKIKYTEEAKN